MAIEKGVIIKLGPNGTQTAWVKTLQPSACKGCTARKDCSSASGGQEQLVEAVNKVGAQVGDIIQIYMDTALLLKAAFLLYVFPILCMLAGGAVGHAASKGLGMPSSWPSMVAAVGCFIGAMVLVRIRAGRMALKMAYRPKIIRVIGRQKEMPDGIYPPGDCSLPIASSI
jgi:sigma-E factor negative regulatory protein RseC